MNTMRVDLHVHSHYSRDSMMRLETIIDRVERRGLDGIALIDHNTIAGAQELARVAPFFVIVGEECKTAEGEIVGLFLEEAIPGGLSPEETIAAIRAQGGIVCIPHPTDRLRTSPLKRPALMRVLDRVDALETLNARVILHADNAEAQALAREHGIPQYGGSDAHSPIEIGRAWTKMPSFSNRDTFLAALAAARPAGRESPPCVHASSTWAKHYKKWTKQGGQPR
jgi:predicted metal-dependent phosphoesterase TrpH